MVHAEERMRSHRTSDERRRDIRLGMKRGAVFGIGFSLIATVGVLFGKAAFISDNPIIAWLYLLVYYMAGGLGAGALVGWMRPLSRWYVGRLLIAYVVILMAYGGGTVAFWPVLRRDGNVPLTGLLILWAILAIPLAPMYVAVSKKWTLE